MANVPGMVRTILREIVISRRNVMMLVAPQRAKFEGWLKLEIAAALSGQRGIQNVVLEASLPLEATGRADLSFQSGGRTWYVELKTANVNWRAGGVEDKRRPVTKNVSAIIEDVAKLREKCPPAKGLAAFAIFPVPTRVWQDERDKLLYHLHRIERESGLIRDSLIESADWVLLNEQFGVVLFVVEAV